MKKHPSVFVHFPFLVIIGTLFSMSAAQETLYDAAFFTRVKNDLPTAADSVWIISKGYFQIGSRVVDSSFSLSGNTLTQKFIVRAVDSMSDSIGITLLHSPGKLAPGAYRVITTTSFLAENPQTAGIDTTRYCDTTGFHVVAAGTPTPRVVGTTTIISGESVRGDAALTYYYRNGDTLSIAVAFQLGYMPLAFMGGFDRRGDTVVIDITDTTRSEMAMPMFYLTIVSLCPVPPGDFPLRVNFKRWSCLNPFVNDTMAAARVDCFRECIGIGVNSGGAPKAVLYPDTVLNDYPYYLVSAGLDTVRDLSLMPDPVGATPRRHDLYVGQVRIGYQDVVYMDSTYRNERWQPVLGQTGDAVAVDTVSTADKGAFFHVNYSSGTGNALKSYVRYPLDTPFIIWDANSPLRLYASYAHPDSITSGVRFSQQGSRGRANMRDFVVIKKGPAIEMLFHAAAGTVLSNAGTRLAIVDLRGRLVKRCPQTFVDKKTGTVIAEWDGRNIAGERTGPGTYIALLQCGNAVSAGKIVLRP